MTQPLLTAVTHRWETELAAVLGRSPLVHLARRCADLPELLGAAAAGVGAVAVISVDLKGLDRTRVAQLSEAGLRVLGVHPPGDEAGEHTLHRWGVEVVLPADAQQVQVDAALGLLLAEPAAAQPHGTPGLRSAGQPRGESPLEADRDGADPEGSGGAAEPLDPPAPEAAEGTVVVVWGPVGAPGRSTMAVNLAAELAAPTVPVVLVDADTYGASVASLLAVLDEAPGVAAAVRAADHGRLDRVALARMAPEVAPGFRVLTGLPRADRWPELSDHALADVLHVCRNLCRYTVVDVASCLEEDEELSFDTAAPRRNGATLTALEAADHVIVVGTADPVGLHRLVRGLQELNDVNSAPRTVVVTRVRADAVGSNPGRRVQEALARFAGLREVHLVPEDRAAMDAARLRGQTLRECAPTSPARVAIAEVAELLGGPVRSRSGRRRLRRAAPG